ncbi:MAG TPA: aldehyde dehydrogenase family protein [Vicinamibacterales bacterium]
MADTKVSVADIYESMSYGPAPESDSPAQAWLADHAPHLRLFIGGEWREPSSGEYFPTVNPATATPLIDIAQGTAKDVDAAVRAAREAFPAWSGLSGHARARYLYALARQIQKHSRLLAVLETMDNGKPIRETRDLDIPLVARHFYHHAGWAQLLSSEMPEMGPVGVVGQIIPWNFPLLMLAWKIAPALAAGNTVVLKPAETTPLTALLFCDVLRQAELPPGVVNIVTGDGSTGAALVKHEDVDKIAFTGSTEVGKAIQRELAGTGKRLTLELGGKAANVVFDDAALDQAVEGIVNGIYFNQGHVCCAGSRLFVQESIYEPLVEKLKRRLTTLRVGDPLDKNTDVGAINSAQQLEKIRELVAAGEEEGAEIFQPPCRLPEKGYWFAPTVFTNVAQSYRIAQEEIFGPVLSVLTFRTPDEAVEKANNTPYGLSAGVWTEKGSRILWMAQRLRAGVVWANTYNRFDPASPFGGYKESGFGREGGLHGLEPYLSFEDGVA